eukprot:m.91080 g.91080  ORF g.91080 m.91080 type:complete len:147 (+) comp14614_c0_seq5:72-512(+)
MMAGGVHQACSRIGAVMGSLVQRQPSTAVTRMVYLLMFSSMLVFHGSCDAFLDQWWSWLRETWWFKHDSFEPMLATVSFFPWLSLFYLLDNYTPAAQPFRLNKHSADMSSWLVRSHNALSFCLRFDPFVSTCVIPSTASHATYATI